MSRPPWHTHGSAPLHLAAPRAKPRVNHRAHALPSPDALEAAVKAQLRKLERERLGELPRKGRS